MNIEIPDAIVEEFRRTHSALEWEKEKHARSEASRKEPISGRPSISMAYIDAVNDHVRTRLVLEQFVLKHIRENL